MFLADAVANLGAWKRKRGTKGRCLEATHWACHQAHALIAGGKTAWDSFLLMKADCAKYGYEPAKRDKEGRLPGEGGQGYCVVYFCSTWWCWPFFKKRPGHVGILHNDVIYSDVDHKFTGGWIKRLKGAFVPQKGK